MEWIYIIFGIFLLILELGLEMLLFSRSKREESEDGFIAKTHAPKKRVVTLTIMGLFSILLFITIVVILILTQAELDFFFWLVYSFGSLFLFGPPFILLLISKNDYEIIKQDGIFVHRLCKKFFIRYEEMGKYEYDSVYNQLIVYDNDGTVLFLVADMRIGVLSIVKELEKHGVAKISTAT